jgi:hypothetical protein
MDMIEMSISRITVEEAKKIMKTINKIVQKNKDPNRLILVSAKGVYDL